MMNVRKILDTTDARAHTGEGDHVVRRMETA